MKIYLRVNILKILINLMFKIKTDRLSNEIKNKIFKSRNIRRHTTFQLFGCDIILDQNLNPYILEFNKGPEMTPKNDEDY